MMLMDAIAKTVNSERHGLGGGERAFRFVLEGGFFLSFYLSYFLSFFNNS